MLGQVINTLIQFVSVPIFLQCWGIQLYGEWLILFLIPSYLAISDLGFATSAGNEITMLTARDDRQQAVIVYQSVLALITILCIASFLVVLLAVDLLPVKAWLNITLQDSTSLRYSIMFLTLYILIGIPSGLVAMGFLCEGNAALLGMWGNIFKVIESAVTLILVYFKFPVIVVAASYPIIRLLSFFILSTELKRLTPWLVLGFNNCQFSVIKRLTKPSMAFMLAPMTQALTNQGVVAVVSINLGAQATVIFSTLRTLSRIVLQIGNVINLAVRPEISLAYGKNDTALLKSIHRKACKVTLWFSIVSSLFLLIAGSVLLQIWTRGKIDMDYLLFIIFLATLFGNVFGYTSGCILLATNNHQGFAVRNLIGAISTLTIAIVLIQFWGLYGVAIASLMTEFWMSSYIMKTSLKIVEDNFSDFFKTLISPPKLNISRF
jgi:O-antigen/teichoic acid export membrane protein